VKAGQVLGPILVGPPPELARTPRLGYVACAHSVGGVPFADPSMGSVFFRGVGSPSGPDGSFCGDTPHPDSAGHPAPLTGNAAAVRAPFSAFMFAYEKLPGLPRDRLLDAIEPVLRAHGLAGVELVWRTDAQGRVLYMTVENAESAQAAALPAGELAAGELVAGAAPAETAAEAAEASDKPVEPGQGVTLEVCSRVSRDLSTAFDVLELIDGNYRLEVGSPGLERKLYALADYRRFRGKLAKIKLGELVAGQSVIVGTLGGVDAEGRVVLESDDAPKAELTRADGTLAPRTIAFDNIRSGQLVVDWQGMGFSPRQRAGRRSITPRPKGSGVTPRPEGSGVTPRSKQAGAARGRK
jgi:ribosome maturation factor RimP